MKTTLVEWSNDKAPRLGAALAYYTVFSLAPLLVVALAVVGLAFEQEAAEGSVYETMRELVGAEGARLIETMVERAGRGGRGIWATILGLSLLLFGATTVFAQLQDALNEIWRVKPKKRSGWWSLLRSRLLSLGLVVGIGFLLLVSLMMSTMLAVVGNYLQNVLPGGDTLWRLLNALISFGVITFLFAAIYKVLPDARIRWRDVMLGAAVTAFLFTVGKYLIGLYIGNSSFGSVYGAAGSLVVILVWVYYSAQIVFLGAEFTQVWARRHGRSIAPEPFAEETPPG